MLDSTPNTITIQLTKGYQTVIDDCDAELAEFKWYAAVNASKYAYAARGVMVNGSQVHNWIHRVILEKVLGRDLVKGEWCDHINHDTLDNRRSNLRLATIRQNAQNRKVRPMNQSGYKGVSKCAGGYVAKITVDGKTRRLGQTYATPEEAYVMYCRAAREHFGEFAYLVDEDKVKDIIPVRVGNKLAAAADAKNTTLEVLIPELLERLGTVRLISEEMGTHYASVQNWLKRNGYTFVKGQWIK